ncbi:arylsulfatase B-like [Penaeus chinensis]|uniref:arylsulfatase B-like n=1 Tax=Penaeus chinensis TaxID=139456 RepID=UPI001FB60DA8|nr:arylsulfatase B-like [Penaeus chinensis]
MAHNAEMCLWALVLFSSSAAASLGQPHIVFIVADDLGWNDVSWHNPHVVTPHLEELAKGGVILEQSYVQPICTPTRSALLTGRYPFTLGRQHSVLKDNEPTGLTLNATLLPQALKKAGYSTHAVGKWHLGFCSWDYTPTKRGFDTFYGYYNGAEDYFTHHRGYVADSGWPGNPLPREKSKRDYLDLRNNTEPDGSKEGIYSAHLFASYVEELLASRNPKTPMFLYFPFQSCHAPLMVPEEYMKPYLHIHDVDRRTYLGMVTAMDEAVGRVVAALKSTGHYDNSVIVFTTDNGGPTKHGANNWPLRGYKTTLWEGGTRGAAFIHSPLLPNPGAVSHKMIHVTDWYQTLVGLAGGVAPADTDGFDQWASLTGSAPSPRTQLIYNLDDTDKFKAGIRVGDMKLLINPGNAGWTPPPEINLSNQEPPHNHVTVAEKVSSKNFRPTENNKNSIHVKRDKSQSWNHARRGRLSQGHKPLLKRELMKNESTVLEEPYEDLQTVFHSRDPREQAGAGGDVAPDQDKSFISESSDDKNDLKLDYFFRKDVNIQLYNVKDDPDERVDLSKTESDTVGDLLKTLLKEMSRYVAADIKPGDPRAHPKHWNDIWTPGWC